MPRIPIVVVVLLIAGCTGLPEAVRPVSGFDLNRYLGSWYEIARLDHPFERGLRDVSAHYSLRDDGGIRVLNRGYADAENAWQQAEGKAYFVGDSRTGQLKVSFFGPFYGSYAVFALDADYQYAFVSGNSTDYLWLLARTPRISTALQQQFIAHAQALGFDTSTLIWVTHSAPTN